MEKKETVRVAEVKLLGAGRVYVCKCGGIYLAGPGYPEVERIDLAHLETLVEHLTILTHLSKALRYLKTGGADEPKEEV